MSLTAAYFQHLEKKHSQNKKMAMTICFTNSSSNADVSTTGLQSSSGQTSITAEILFEMKSFYCGLLSFLLPRTAE